MTIDDDLVDRLLDGSIDADDLPTDLAVLGSVLRAAAAPPRPDEQEPGPDAIRRIFEQARRPPVVSGAHRTERPATRRWAVRTAVAAVIGTFTLSGGAALAATGNLPAPAQSAAHELLAAVGVDVPDAPEADPEPSDGPNSTDAPGPTTSPPATGRSTPLSTVEPTTVVPSTTDVAVVPGAGDEVCQDVGERPCVEGEDGKAGNDGTAGDHGNAGDHDEADDEHPSATRPPVTELTPPTSADPAPGHLDNPSATHPENPSATAPGQTKDNGKNNQ